MNFLKKLLGTSRKDRPARRPVPARLHVEALEDRQLMSAGITMSAFTTHPSSVVTNHDLYAIDAAIKTVVDFHNGSKISPVNPDGTRPQGVYQVSAGVDAQGSAEVYALDKNSSLSSYDGGKWKDLSTTYFADISATRDGQVFAADGHGGHTHRRHGPQHPHRPGHNVWSRPRHHHPLHFA